MELREPVGALVPVRLAARLIDDLEPDPVALGEEREQRFAVGDRHGWEDDATQLCAPERVAVVCDAFRVGTTASISAFGRSRREPC